MVEAPSLTGIDPVPAAVSCGILRPAPEEIAALENAAQALNSQISQGHKSLARTYWELGDTLVRLRPFYGRGTWEEAFDPPWHRVHAGKTGHLVPNNQKHSMRPTRSNR